MVNFLQNSKKKSSRRMIIMINTQRIMYIHRVHLDKAAAIRVLYSSDF